MPRNRQQPRLLPNPSVLRWPTVNSGCAHTDPLLAITLPRWLMSTGATARWPRRPPSRWPLRLILIAVAALLVTMAISTNPAVAAQHAPDSQRSPGSQPTLAGPAARFSWPLPPPHPVLRPFQPPSTPYGPGHRGVDLAGSIGEPVFAAGDGLVLYAGPLFGCELISIEHPGGLRTTYTPVDPTVRVGQQVRREQLIGRLLAARPSCPEEVGNNGNGPPVFLYWGVHRERDYLDPLRLVNPGDIRLLPWPGDAH